MLKAGGTLQVAMQMGPGPGYPGGPPPPNFFNLPPGGGMYPSMDPSQAGTRAQRGDGSEAGTYSLSRHCMGSWRAHPGLCQQSRSSLRLHRERTVLAMPFHELWLSHEFCRIR